MAKQQASISAAAHAALGEKIRQWSGWRDASLVFGVPTASPFAQCDPTKHQFTVNADELVLNPNRVVGSITPFRLKQEAVLTGAMLHEAAHARYSLWRPTNEAEAAMFKHERGLGDKPTAAVMALATVAEEARIEGKMAAGADHNGAAGLSWTMRASAAKLLPMTSVHGDHGDKALMDLISAWILRAGRATAMYLLAGQPRKTWVAEFSDLLQERIIEMAIANGSDNPIEVGVQGLSLLESMVSTMPDTGTAHIDLAKAFLDLVFPETGGRTEQPVAGGGCESSTDEGDEQEQTSASDDEGDEDGEDQTQAALSKVEAKADAETLASAADDEKSADEREMLRSQLLSKSRQPSKDERDIAHTAEKFLRALVEPTESSTTVTSEQPSSLVDGAAYTQWRASGGQRDPRFFRRTQRSVEPSPPVKVAILVDRSASMEALQKPSAVLAWALASAATDLSNFAGRGQQIEVCMVHWGATAKLTQAVGTQPSGISSERCAGGTYAQADALAIVEAQMPGFFDAKEKPEHRLLIQFTDWELNGSSAGFDRARHTIHRGLCSGMDMLTVAPRGYTGRKSVLPHIMFGIKGQTGRSLITKYNSSNPGDVWEKASEVLL